MYNEKTNNDQLQENNKYKDYLPENRFAQNNNKTTKKIVKIGLFPFYILVIIFIIISVFWFNGNNLLKTKKRVYNLNLAESINLDTIYKSNDVEWVSTSENVVIENNVVKALKSGDAYIYAKKDNLQVSDITIKVLTGEESLSLEKHSVSSIIGDVNKIGVTQIIKNEEIPEISPKEEFIDWIKNIYEKIIPTNEENSNNTQNNNSDLENQKQNQDNNQQHPNNQETNNKLERESEEDETDITDEEDETNNNLTYESSDNDIVKVDQDGNITSISPGTAEITVKDEYGNEDHTIIIVQDDDIILYNTEYNLYEGDQAIIGYTIDSNQYTQEDIKWQSENTNVATIENGQITAIKEGKTNIIVSLGKITKKIKVNVGKDEILPTNLELSSQEEEINVGSNKTITAKVYPENVTNSNLNWVSDNNDIATVNNGKIIGKSVGETNISVTTINGIEKKIKVIIKSEPVEVENIIVQSPEINMLVGELSKLQYTILPNSATDKKVTVNYDENYLSIDTNNNIIAKKPGTSIINIVSSNGKNTNVTINISEVSQPIQTILITEKNIKIDTETTKKLTATTSCQSINWSSTDSNIVTTDTNGNIKGIENGTAEIIAKCGENNNISDSIKVTVTKVNKEIPMSEIKLDKNFIELKQNESSKLEMTLSPNNATNQTVSWNSSNTNIVTIDGTGNIKAIESGTATITVTSKENPKIMAQCQVVVTIPINNIKINEGNITVNKNTTSKLTTTISPANTTNKEVFWQTSNPNIISVDQNGNIKAIESGTATITVTSKENKTISNSITITAKEIDNKLLTKVVVDKKNTIFLLNNQNKSKKIKATLTTTNKNDSIVWSSSNSNIATVNKDGIITATNIGTTTIRASSKLDSSKYDEINVTVRKNIAIVIGASQVTRMAGAAKNNEGEKNFISNNRNTYSVSNKTLYYFYKGGSGKNYQIGDGFNKAKKIIESYSSVKDYVSFYIFFPIAGNDVKKYNCKNINDTVALNYIKNYYDNITKVKSNGYSVISYIIGVHPVNTSYISSSNKKNTKVVTNSNKNSCAEKYRSNRKYNKFNQAIEQAIKNNYASQINYREYLTTFLNTNVVDGKNFHWKKDWKKKYATVEDGVHWKESTTKIYVKLMLNGANI